MENFYEKLLGESHFRSASFKSSEEVKMNNKYLTGAFMEKISLIDIINEYKETIQLVSAVHDKGAAKYPCYSFRVERDAPNASISDNINALFRHFLAHSMGKTIDVEGFPHIWHIACRAAMLVTAFYKNNLNLFSEYKGIFSFLTIDEIKIGGHQITEEFLFALSKTSLYEEEIPNDIGQLKPLIMSKLISITENLDSLQQIGDSDIFTTKFQIELLSLLLIRFVKLFSDKHPELIDFDSDYQWNNTLRKIHQELLPSVKDEIICENTEVESVLDQHYEKEPDELEDNTENT